MSEIPPSNELELEIEIAELDREIATLETDDDDDYLVLLDERTGLKAQLAMLRHRRRLAASTQQET